MEKNWRIVLVDSENKHQVSRVETWMWARGWERKEEDVGWILFERKEPLGPLELSYWFSGPPLERSMRFLLQWFRSFGGVFLLMVFLFLGVGFFLFSQGEGQRSSGGSKKAVEVSEGAWGYIVADTLNVRESGSLKAEAVGVLYRGQRVWVEEKKEEWVRISAPERGWIFAKYVKSRPEKER